MTHFNQAASSWDSLEKIESTKILANKVIEKLQLQPNCSLDILDFGCGTGLLGLNFFNYAKSITGIDTSEGMLNVFQDKVKDFKNVNILNLDLEKSDIQLKFDLIVTAMAFHHLERPNIMIKKFQSMLNVNSKIAIIDLVTEDGTFHPDNLKMGVKHFGFSKNLIEEWSRNKIDFSIINEISKNGKVYPQFLAVIKNEEK